MTVSRVNWRAVIVFYVLACTFSWPFFWWRDRHGESWQALDLPWFIKASLIMGGPAFGAVIVMYVLRMRPHRRRMTLLGHAPAWSLAALAVTFACWTAAGADTLTRPELLMILSVGSVTYLLGEELGWRGFLQDALHPLRPLWRYIVIGVMWEAWHFTNRLFGTPGEVAVRLLFSYPLVILHAAVIGYAVERTRSIMVAVAIHASVNATFEIGGQFGRPVGALVAAAVCGSCYVVLIRRWPRVPEDGLSTGRMHG